MVPCLGPRDQQPTGVLVIWFDAVSINGADPQRRTSQYSLQDGPSSYRNGIPNAYFSVAGNVELMVIAASGGVFTTRVADVPAGARGGAVFLGTNFDRVWQLTDQLRSGIQNFVFDLGAVVSSLVGLSTSALTTPAATNQQSQSTAFVPAQAGVASAPSLSSPGTEAGGATNEAQSASPTLGPGASAMISGEKEDVPPRPSDDDILDWLLNGWLWQERRRLRDDQDQQQPPPPNNNDGNTMAEEDVRSAKCDVRSPFMEEFGWPAELESDDGVLPALAVPLECPVRLNPVVVAALFATVAAERRRPKFGW
jgi:hypothetical protein